MKESQREDVKVAIMAVIARLRGLRAEAIPTTPFAILSPTDVILIPTSCFLLPASYFLLPAPARTPQRVFISHVSSPVHVPVSSNCSCFLILVIVPRPYSLFFPIMFVFHLHPSALSYSAAVLQTTWNFVLFLVSGLYPLVFYCSLSIPTLFLAINSVSGSSSSLLCDSFPVLPCVVFSLHICTLLFPISDTRLLSLVPCLHELFFSVSDPNFIRI
jgi:hypothetical protein